MTLDRTNIGMVYVATRRPQYVAEAFLSACSARDFAPDLQITLCTDLHELPFARSPAFTQVVPLATRRRFRSLWAEGQLDRINALQNSPYDYTLHLDTDTRILTPEFLSLFDKLDRIDIGMAVCQRDVSRCAQLTGRLMFNVGFILFRRSPGTLALLQGWQELTRKNFELGNLEDPPRTAVTVHIDDRELRRELLFMDQTSFVELLSPEVNRYGLEREVIDECWNFRGAGRGRVFEGPVKISHEPALRARLGEDIIQRAAEYQRGGRPALARAILQCLHDELVPAENAAGRAHVRALIDACPEG
ncbi:MAG: hypothetical protein L6Q83_08410 [Gammaproteobacteria bacterium]|nr:hypothetical protein [Gammaproteobacteria bacterium]